LLKPVLSEHFHTEIESSADLHSGTVSAKWGSDQMAAARARLEPKVTDSNKELFRTHHPSLSQQTDVYWREESDGRSSWVVEIDGHHVGTHAGGIGIHLIPRGFAQKLNSIRPNISPANHREDPIPEALDPRKCLAPTHSNILREMFPTSTGARVLVSGFIVLLFEDRAAIEKSWAQDGILHFFGNLKICYDVMEDTGTLQGICSGANISLC
jgi:hypothetical protein